MSSPDFTVGSTWPSLDESKAGVQASRQFWRADREEKDQAERGGEGSSRKGESDRVQDSKGITRAKGLESKRIKEDGDASIFVHQIVNFAPAHFPPTHFAASHYSTYIFRIYIRTYIACILAALTHPIHLTVTLDSGSEARYVRRQGRGLGI